MDENAKQLLMVGAVLAILWYALSDDNDDDASDRDDKEIKDLEIEGSTEIEEDEEDTEETKRNNPSSNVTEEIDHGISKSIGQSGR